MTCSSCTLAVEQSLLGRLGVVNVVVSLLQAEAKVEYHPDDISEVWLPVRVEEHLAIFVSKRQRDSPLTNACSERQPSCLPGANLLVVPP